MLTQDQIDHFHPFGFLVLRQVLTQDEVARMKRDADQITEARKDLDPSKHRKTAGFFERSPFLTILLDDDRIYSIGVDLIGPDFLLEGTASNLRVGGTIVRVCR